MILLDRDHLGLVDLEVDRNAYGRQVASFEADLELDGEAEPLRGVFIRAPRVRDVGPEMEVLAELDGEPVLLRQGRFLVASFHPELTDDTRVHERFLELVREEIECRGIASGASIKHKKGAADAKRGQLFTKLTRALIVAAKDGGPDPAANLALQNAIDKARAASMPKDNIERAIARGAGTGADAAAYEHISYEGYGPAASPSTSTCSPTTATGRRARCGTSSRAHDGNLAESGAVAWLFERKGVILVDAGTVDEDELMLAAADAGRGRRHGRRARASR